MAYNGSCSVLPFPIFTDSFFVVSSGSNGNLLYIFSLLYLYF